MAEQFIIPRNADELNKLYQGVKELEVAAGSASKESIERTVAASTAEQDLRAKIARGELSPESIKREREAISGLFGATAGIEKEFEGIPIDPLRLRNIVSGRMKTYLDQIGNIQDQRKSRQGRIDEILKDEAKREEAKALQKQLEFKQKESVAKTAREEFEFLFQAAEKRKERAEDKAAKRGKVKIGGIEVSDSTAAFLGGISKLENMTKDTRSEVEGDLSSLGLSSSIPADWFRISAEEEEQQSLPPEIIQRLWDKERDDILLQTTKVDTTGGSDFEGWKPLPGEQGE